MRYATFKCGPWSKPSAAFKLFGWVLPRVNPDFEAVYQQVTHWWLEIDDNGQVLREIGFTEHKYPVAIAPFGKNFGIFTDIEGPPAPLGPEVGTEAFEQAWRAVETQHGTSHKTP